MTTLSLAQRAALEHVSAYARARSGEARAVQDEVCRLSDIAPAELEDAKSLLRNQARVALHFHPDRPIASGKTVADALLDDGRYLSQFETGISNGGLTAHAGGHRDLTEQLLFAGAYQSPEASPNERPKYGSLALLGHAEGPSPRFGSCYFLLTADVTRRCTFTFSTPPPSALPCVTALRIPPPGAPGGTQAEVLQELKLLWHVLLKYGKPTRPDDKRGALLPLAAARVAGQVELLRQLFRQRDAAS